MVDDVVPPLYVKTVGELATVTGKEAGEEVKTAFVAVKLIGVVVPAVGVPDITPVLGLSERPAGKGMAAKDTGDLDAVIVYGVIAFPIVKDKGVKELVITGLCCNVKYKSKYPVPKLFVALN